MGILDGINDLGKSLDSINQSNFRNNKRKHDDDILKIEYGSLQLLAQIRDLLAENNALLKKMTALDPDSEIRKEE